MREYLIKLRDSKHMTQMDVANRLGCSVAAYCRIERGERQKDMGVELAQRLATALEVTVEWILEQEISMIATQ